MLEEKQNGYIVKKGAADPFRGNWYIEDKNFSLKDEAVEYAAELTLTNYNEFLLNWEEFGYEWSVFETINEVENKIWEGYKFIKSSFTSESQNPDMNNGWL